MRGKIICWLILFLSLTINGHPKAYAITISFKTHVGASDSTTIKKENKIKYVPTTSAKGNRYQKIKVSKPSHKEKQILEKEKKKMKERKDKTKLWFLNIFSIFKFFFCTIVVGIAFSLIVKLYALFSLKDVN